MGRESGGGGSEEIEEMEDLFNQFGSSEEDRLASNTRTYSVFLLKFIV